MKIRLLILISIAIAATACTSKPAPRISENSPAPGITSYESSGNLQSTHHIGCIAPDNIKDIYTPADLYPAIVKCVRKKQYRNAAFIFGLAGVYTRFDEQRVADTSSHDVTSVYMYRFGSIFSDSQKKQLFKSISAVMSNPHKLQTYCARIRKIGPPDYYPRYMVQHGMQAFTGEKSQGGLVKNFDPQKAWEKSLDTYLHCPGAK